MPFPTLPNNARGPGRATASRGAAPVQSSAVSVRGPVARYLSSRYRCKLDQRGPRRGIPSTSPSNLAEAASARERSTAKETDGITITRPLKQYYTQTTNKINCPARKIKRSYKQGNTTSTCRVCGIKRYLHI